MTKNLHNKTVNAVFWSGIERFGQQSIQFVIGIILARLLSPREFGLIGMLAIFFAVARSIINSGFGSALIQKKDATHIDESSIFYFNVVLGFVGAGILCLAAPLIAKFYEIPILVPLTRIFSITLIIGSFSIVQTSLLSKIFDFKTQAKAGLAATLISGLVGITLAFCGFGVWSLIALRLCSSFIRTVLYWGLSQWRPTLEFSFSALKSMFGFGSKMLFSGLLNTIFNNIYLLLIGKLFSATALGFYSRAKSTQQIPVKLINNIIGRVAFPVFSSIQHDKEHLKRGIRKAIKTLAMVNFPMMVGLALVARPLVLVLLTEKWEPCVPYLQLLCVAGMIFPIHAINLSVLKARGRSDLFFRLEILKKIMTVIAISITYRWGISAMICGGIATSCIAFFINTHYTGKLLNYTGINQVRDLLPIFAVVGIMGTVVYAIGLISFSSELLELITSVSVGTLLYLALCFFARFPIFMESMDILKKKLNNRNRIRSKQS